MKLITASILALVGLVAAQSTGDLPKCAQPCVIEATTGGNIGGCGQFDNKCICSNKSFLDDMACCLAAGCTQKEQQAAVDFAKRLCRGSGVTDLPDSVVCKTAASGSSTTASGTAAATTSASQTASTTGSAANAQNTASTSTPNAGPLATMMPVGVLGGLIAAAAML
ncbi:hypothetical protein D7B24_000105 [Verticillium nonalfalfae]|uniref:CFEM domain-containing protein n=1 Tax=Verticillium nonalfalfae TaxID=1051616 RepID=A0A3M9YMF5_9PEZI|nr:uncharacterized protein D7B24_000105 [Verticillium nonalfalfae]RNJ61251.1 hypothetical protein D7B24_000105 [Verticillium nonalfalfae]